ncbi:hypothetical protein Tcan_15292 [Toxocara canis]|uniref:Uncharacterized protein n=1 Tax=Toxocara canis TaxID=6265 RepID=A0A0B2VNB3_TOXCA|nr:hypothetical protein Tcan_15292 [Toxocara canis]
MTDRFVSETDVEEARRRRQEEWEKVEDAQKSCVVWTEWARKNFRNAILVKHLYVFHHLCIRFLKWPPNWMIEFKKAMTADDGGPLITFNAAAMISL